MLVLTKASYNSACPTVKTCLHNGLFNDETCACECFSAYKGNKLRKKKFIF